jgi:hypothetical protein
MSMTEGTSEGDSHSLVSWLFVSCSRWIAPPHQCLPVTHAPLRRNLDRFSRRELVKTQAETFLESKDEKNHKKVDGEQQERRKDTFWYTKTLVKKVYCKAVWFLVLVEQKKTGTELSSLPLHTHKNDVTAPDETAVLEIANQWTVRW